MEDFLRAVQAAAHDVLDAKQVSFLHRLMQIMLSDETGHSYQLAAMSEKYSTLCGGPSPRTNVIEGRLKRFRAWQLYRELADKRRGQSSDEEQW